MLGTMYYKVVGFIFYMQAFDEKFVKGKQAIML